MNTMLENNFAGKLLRLFVVLFGAWLVTACGGGGGSPGNTTKTALFTTAPSALLVSPGETKTFTISGGVTGYTATSSAGSVIARVSGSQLSITAAGIGAATVVVSDSAGAVVSISVTVGSGVTLFTTAPSNLLLSVGDTKTFTISGGVTGYTATSSAGSVIARVSGSQLSITAGGGGTATVAVSDSGGATVLIQVAVGSGLDLFTSAGTTVTVAVGATSSQYTIGGGSELYAISSGNIGVATVGISGNRFVINGVAGGKATVTVRDSVGKTVSIDVVVGSPNALFTSSGPDISVAVGEIQTFAIGGGSTPYSVSSTNTTFASASVSGTTLTIRGVAAGSAIVVVSDALGTSVKINVTVGAPPSALFTTAAAVVTLAPRETTTYTIGGGIQPYSVSSSNTSSVNATVSGTTLTLSATTTGGNAQVVVTDATGKTVAIAVTVGSGPAIALFTSAPSAITISPGASPNYSVGGGTAPYTATSSNVGVVTTNVVGATLTINGVSAGVATVVIRDAVGATVTLNVTTSSVAGPSLAVYPSTAIGNAGDTLTFTVAGGTPGYTATINNPGVATVSPTTVASSAGTFTAKLLNAGATTISIIDVSGQTQTVTLTVNQVSPLLRLSPSALQIGEDNNNAIVLNVFGGTGPYRAFTSDLNRAPVTGVGVVGTALTIDAVAATARCFTADSVAPNPAPGSTYVITVTVVDSLGASATSALTIKDNSKGGAACS